MPKLIKSRVASKQYMLRKVKLLSQREQRRRQARQENSQPKGMLTGSHRLPFVKGVSSTDGSGFGLEITFSKKDIQTIGTQVMEGLFGASELDVTSYYAAAVRQEDAFASVKGSLEDLLGWDHRSNLLRDIGKAERAVQEFRAATEDYTAHPMTKVFDSYSSGMPVWMPEAIRGNGLIRYFTFLATGPWRAERTRKMFERAFKQQIEDRIKFTSGKATVTRENMSEHYAASINSVRIISQRFHLVSGIETVVRKARHVAENGSPDAAHLYLARLVRIVAPENAEPGQRVNTFLQNIWRLSNYIGTGRFTRALRVDYGEEYADIGRLKLEGLLSAIDHEERRTRYGRVIAHRVRNSINFTLGPKYIFDLSQALEKKGAQAEDAAEMLGSAPIGERKRALKLLKNNPEFVLLYRTVKQYGVDARSVMQFLAGFSGIKTSLNGEPISLYGAVNRLAARRGDAAAWLLQHPDAWIADDIPKIFALAMGPQSIHRLNLYYAFKDDVARKKVVLELAPTLSSKELATLSEVLPRIPASRLAAISKLSLEQIVAVQNEGLQSHAGSNGRNVKAESSSGNDTFIYALLGIPHQQNPRLASSLTVLATKFHPRLEYRIKQAYSYAGQNNGSSEGVFVQAITQLAGMSPKLLGYMLQDDRFFEAFLERSSEDGLAKRLESVVAADGNTYVQLKEALLPKPTISERVRGIIPFPVLSSGNGNNETWDGDSSIIYRVAILGNVEARRAEELRNKLAAYGIEPVFVLPSKRGNPPDCDGVLVVPSARIGEATPHSSVPFSYYRNGNYAIRVANSSGTKSIADAAISFRNDLAFRRTEKISA